MNQIEYYSQQFEKLPLYFLKFHGSQRIDEIISTMEFAVVNHDIQVIVLDNLQFMTGGHFKINKFDYQDEIIHKLRLFATEKNVHVFLVIHPKKTDEALKITSIFGTGKASQEADNIFILQSFKGLRIVELAKNRFDGSTGKTVLGFNKATCRFLELTEEEFMRYVRNEVKIEDIIKTRQGTAEGSEPIATAGIQSGHTVRQDEKRSNINKEIHRMKSSPLSNMDLIEDLLVDPNANNQSKPAEAPPLENSEVADLLEMALNTQKTSAETISNSEPPRKMEYNLQIDISSIGNWHNEILPRSGLIHTFHTEESKSQTDAIRPSSQRPSIPAQKFKKPFMDDLF